jgi:hypothetical protein
LGGREAPSPNDNFSFGRSMRVKHSRVVREELFEIKMDSRLLQPSMERLCSAGKPSNGKEVSVLQLFPNSNLISDE